jgi:hypothetical protein
MKDALNCAVLDNLSVLNLRFITVYENNLWRTFDATPLVSNTFIEIPITPTSNPLLEDLPLGIVYLITYNDYLCEIYFDNELIHTELIKVK